MAAVLLIYHMENGRRKILEGLCASMGVRSVFADAESSHVPIGVLSGSMEPNALWNCGMTERDSTAGDAGQPAPSGREPDRARVHSTIEEEMIVMCGFTKAQFDAFLEMLRMAGLKIGLKAVETPANRSWTGEMLHRELSREREAIRTSLRGTGSSSEGKD